ncbi:BglII/BstYI family type II restriction endonuclease [Desulfohalovibrio reitneri]|uniref:BglII/BstYI family type II restriction endonuclease n=1 Tax=Desulfohalovibrio reitneri TaxID=1307759 RepID=UPI0009DE1D2F|nr:BglII/BstYI family type II restriction endonuclease [Desulfohalovibrio reitneri]
MTIQDFVPEDIQALYEVHEYRHAAALLACDLRDEYEELCSALIQFRIKPNDVLQSGGSKSQIPKRFASLLETHNGWKEDKLIAQLVVDGVSVQHDTHKVDHLKGRVACDMEWNSKDQKFDRDLYAFRAFHEYGRISAAVLITRSDKLNPWFRELGIMKKYGASTTHMSKLLPRLQAGRSGGCPVLVFGLTPQLIEEAE